MRFIICYRFFRTAAIAISSGANGTLLYFTDVTVNIEKRVAIIRARSDRHIGYIHPKDIEFSSVPEVRHSKMCMSHRLAATRLNVCRYIHKVRRFIPPILLTIGTLRESEEHLNLIYRVCEI
jgi:hypothetical protein